MSEKFRWGLIGPGRIAAQFAEDVKFTDNSELYAVASRSGAKEFVKKYEVPVSYGTYEELVADSKVDGVYIATPHRFHFENTKLCLEAGKPVLCEKPLTVSATEAEVLIELSQNKKVFLMEALWTRFLPIYQKLREWLADKVIGDVVVIQSSFCALLSRDEKDRWLNPELAGGTLLDLGIYPIAVSQWIMQDNPTSIRAQGELGKTGVDELLSVTMKYRSGAISQFITSFKFAKENELMIWGTKGAIRVHDLFLAADTVTLTVDGNDTQYYLPLRNQGFEYEIEDAVKCIQDGLLENAKMSHADTLANMRIMDEIRQEIDLIYPFE